jgi:Holliday junction resolvase RusA-like endonuclease
VIDRLAFRVDGVPATKGSWRIVRGRTLIPDNPGEPAWAQTVAWTARATLRNRLEPDARRYRVRVLFTLPPVTGRGRKNRRDLDKLLRSLLDALTGIVWLDDEQVCKADAEKIVSDRPGADIEIEAIS